MLGLERKGRALALALALLVLAAGSRTASAAEMDDLVGEWLILLMIPESPQTADLKVEKNGEGVVAVLKSPLGENKVEDIALEGEEFVLTYLMNLGEQPMDIQVTAKVDGDNMTGNVLVGGGAMDLQFKGAKVGSEAEAALKKEVAALTAPAGEGPTLPIADAKGFVGEWVLTLVSPQGEREVDFIIKDVEGKAQAEISMPPPMGAVTINKISKAAEGEGLVLNYEIKFGEQPFMLTMNLEKEDEGLKGKISDESGMLSMDFTGITKTLALARSEGVQEDSDGEARRQGEGRGGRGRRGGGRENARMTLNGKAITLNYGAPLTSGDGYKAMQTMVKDGFVWRLGKDAATKLKTETDLKFGDKVIKAGAYSLWAKRVGSGWHLLVNWKADVWGTMHDPEADVAEVPMEMRTLDTPVEKLTIELMEADGTGVLKVQWGQEEGFVKFTAAE